MDVNIKAIRTEAINTNMDTMSLQMNCIDKIDMAELILNAGIADLLKSLGISRKANEVHEKQMKLFRTKKKKALI